MADRLIDTFATVWAIFAGAGFALSPFFDWARAGTEALSWAYLYVVLISITGLAFRAYRQLTTGYRRGK